MFNRRFVAGAFIALGLTVSSVGVALAETVSVAVASNFTATAEKLAAAFKQESGHDLQLSFGATGALYTQITQGAPFQVFLSADTKRPAQAVSDGFGVDGSAFTYAIGKLVLYSATEAVPASEETLRAWSFEKIAIADPETAPYGKAAVETLEKLGLTEATKDKLVTGQNIAQTLQFIDSGNAELGFVAASQVAGVTTGTKWVVTRDLYSPIVQDAVLLTTGEASEGAKAFVDYLKTDAAKAIITADGYGVE